MRDSKDAERCRISFEQERTNSYVESWRQAEPPDCNRMTHCLNKNDLDLNVHSYEKAVLRRVRILTLRFLP